MPKEIKRKGSTSKKRKSEFEQSGWPQSAQTEIEDDHSCKTRCRFPSRKGDSILQCCFWICTLLPIYGLYLFIIHVFLVKQTLV